MDFAPCRKRSMFGFILNIDSVILQSSIGTHFFVNISVPFSETPSLGNVDLKFQYNVSISPAEIIRFTVNIGIYKKNGLYIFSIQ